MATNDTAADQVASATTDGMAFPVIAHWQDNDTDLHHSLGILSGEDQLQNYLVAELDSAFPALCLCFTPITVTEDNSSTEILPDSTIRLLVTPAHLPTAYSITTDTATPASMPPSLQDAIACLNHSPNPPHGPINSLARMHLPLARSPTIAMPRYHRILAHAQDLEHLNALKSLSTATAITLYALPARADDFDTCSAVLHAHEGRGAIKDTRQHYTFSGKATTPWTRYSCREGHGATDPRAARVGEKRKAAGISGGDVHGGEAKREEAAAEEQEQEQEQEPRRQKRARRRRIDRCSTMAQHGSDSSALDTTGHGPRAMRPAAPSLLEAMAGGFAPSAFPATALTRNADAARQRRHMPDTPLYMCWKGIADWAVMCSGCPPEVVDPMVERAFRAQRLGDHEAFAQCVRKLMRVTERYYRCGYKALQCSRNGG